MSLEMLLKFVAVFGSVVRSTVSAPPTIGVDLHAEQRFSSLDLGTSYLSFGCVLGAGYLQI